LVTWNLHLNFEHTYNAIVTTDVLVWPGAVEFTSTCILNVFSELSAYGPRADLLLRGTF